MLLLCWYLCCLKFMLCILNVMLRMWLVFWFCRSDSPFSVIGRCEWDSCLFGIKTALEDLFGDKDIFFWVSKLLQLYNEMLHAVVVVMVTLRLYIWEHLHVRVCWRQWEVTLDDIKESWRKNYFLGSFIVDLKGFFIHCDWHVAHPTIFCHCCGVWCQLSLLWVCLSIQCQMCFWFFRLGHFD